MEPSVSHFEKDAIISGIGISHVGRRTGIPGLDLTLEAARTAIADAGLVPADIDGIATLGDTPRQHVIDALSLVAENRSSGIDTSGLYGPLMSAFLAVSEGRSNHVLVYRTVAMLGGSMLDSSAELPPEPNALASPPTEPRLPGQPRRIGANGDIGELIATHAYSASNWVAMHCRRHMELYGTTKEQLGWMAINSRRNAALNPLAAYRDPITMADYLDARPISSPLGLYDCDVPVDGSIAVVVSHRDYAPDCPNPPVSVEAIGGAYGTGGWFHRDDFPKMASVEAAAQMWSRTDLTPRDLDVAQLYDGFTFLTIAWLEALGICADGEGGPFVEGASRIALDGELPLNTYGGQLSAGRMHGYWVLHEACLQLRGQAGERQLQRRPETAVVAAGGGPIAGCMLLTR
ncbi:MAG: acetyl-CoA acetyltransferase [Mycobacterium sp.]|nr:acetyl-CoA acetyltransferase [Mycobacterium sp.]